MATSSIGQLLSINPVELSSLGEKLEAKRSLGYLFLLVVCFSCTVFSWQLGHAVLLLAFNDDTTTKKVLLAFLVSLHSFRI